ncbi:MAG: hypothetical protein JNM55_19460 [Anaerolineales bacterium]|nr:hypothetical protein [Anaerolineales bacterium]
MLSRVYTQKSKYEIVGQLLQGKRGSLLDIGARDRMLGGYIERTNIQYFSADVDPGHDYQINIEQHIDINDKVFNYVCALDVLEHVENIHFAFSELARITKDTLIIALPNVATLPRRWSFFWKSNLGTAKYALLPEHQRDRHRWLTIYPEINLFIEENARKANFKLDIVYEQLEWIRLFWRIFPFFARLGVFKGGLMTERCIYILTRIQ